jgi:hypothetical protein
MKRLTTFFLWVFFLISFGLHAQSPDSIVVKKKSFKKVVMDSSLVENLTDTSIVSINKKLSKKGRKPEEDRFFYKVFKKDYPNPKTAMLLSFALPGTGQIYNRFIASCKILRNTSSFGTDIS